MGKHDPPCRTFYRDTDGARPCAGMGDRPACPAGRQSRKGNRDERGANGRGGSDVGGRDLVSGIWSAFEFSFLVACRSLSLACLRRRLKLRPLRHSWTSIAIDP